MWPFSRSRGETREPLASVKSVDAREAYRRVRQGARLVDVRSVQEFRAGHPRRARNVLPQLIKERATGLKPDDELLVICQSGHRSARAARELVAQGFTDVSNVSGGLLAWQRAGLPVDK